MKKAVIAVMFVLVLCPVSGIWAAYKEVMVTADTWMNGGSSYSANIAYAGLSYVWVGANKSGLMQVDSNDINEIPDGQVITSAVLDVYVTYTSTTNVAVNIYAETDVWDQNFATWNTSDGSTAWGGSLGGFGVGMVSGENLVGGTYTLVPGSTVGRFQFDVTDAVQGWYDGSVSNKGLLLQRAGGGDFKFYGCRSVGDANTPILKITYEPEGTVPSYEKEVIATADTWIAGAAPDSTYSGLDYLWIGPAKSGLVKVDITNEIPEGQFITNALLDVYITYTDGNTYVNIYNETDEWVEASTTWNTTDGTLPWGGSAGGLGTGMVSGENVLGGTYQTVSSGTSGWFQFDVTDAVQAWYDGSAPNKGLLLQRIGGNGFKFYSREGANAPKLNITYRVPDCNLLWENGHGIEGDLNHDCYVDLDDIGIFVEDWLKCTLPGGTGCESVEGGNPSMQIQQGTVTVDGSLTEWAGVEWIWMDLVPYGVNEDVLEAKFALRWNPDTDKIYAAIVVEDSNIYLTDSWTQWDASDRLEVYCQGDNVGGEYDSANYQDAQQYLVGLKTPATGGYWAAWGDGTSVASSAQFEYSAATSGNQIIYEIGVKQFDNYAGKGGSGVTTVSQLVIDKVVRFDLTIDTRRTETVFGMLNAFSLSIDRWHNANEITQFTLKGLVPSGTCGDWGYPILDLNHNCSVDFGDFSSYAFDWLKCNNPQDENCAY